MIIVNSADIMAELDKQGALYSDRPILEMGGELVGYADTLVLIRYGARFRTYRKYFSSIIGPVPLEDRKHTVEHETRRFLKRVLTSPDSDNLMAHLRKCVRFHFCLVDMLSDMLDPLKAGRRNHPASYIRD